MLSARCARASDCQWMLPHASSNATGVSYELRIGTQHAAAKSLQLTAAASETLLQTRTQTLAACRLFGLLACRLRLVTACADDSVAYHCCGQGCEPFGCVVGAAGGRVGDALVRTRDSSSAGVPSRAGPWNFCMCVAPPQAGLRTMGQVRAEGAGRGGLATLMALLSSGGCWPPRSTHRLPTRRTAVTPCGLGGADGSARRPVPGTGVAGGASPASARAHLGGPVEHVPELHDAGVHFGL